MAKETIKIQGNIKATVCDEFNDLLKKSVRYEPLRYNENTVSKAIGKVIKAGLIELNFWNSLIAYWKRYGVIFSYAMFLPEENIVFINLPAIGIKVSNDCKLYTKPTSDNYQFLANIVAHELIHYIVQNNLTKVYPFARQEILQFYKTFWSHIFTEDIANRIAETHWIIGITNEYGVLDKDIAIANARNTVRFINILEKFLNNRQHVTDINALQNTINIMDSIITGRYPQITPKVQTAFQNAYISIYKGFPLDIQYGQELVFASEILATSTSTNTTEAKHVTRRLLSTLEV